MSWTESVIRVPLKLPVGSLAEGSFGAQGFPNLGRGCAA